MVSREAWEKGSKVPAPANKRKYEGLSKEEIEKKTEEEARAWVQAGMAQDAKRAKIKKLNGENGENEEKSKENSA
jgi:hypothetical protein